MYSINKQHSSQIKKKKETICTVNNGYNNKLILNVIYTKNHINNKRLDSYQELIDIYIYIYNTLTNAKV